MAYAHGALTDEELGPGVLKVVGPAAPEPLKGMVAKGLAPLGARDLVVALYQFWATGEPKLGDEAGKTVVGLPPAVIGGALDDTGLHPGVLDFLGRKYARDAEILDRIVRHPKVDDETLAGVARVCPERVCDTMAENQARWLQCPAIVESLYQNANCRMSVVHRMLELAVRQGLDLHLPNIEEIKAAISDEEPPDPDRDTVFKAATGTAGESQDKLVERVVGAGADDEVDLDAVRAELSDDARVIEELLGDVDDEMSLPLEEDAVEAPAEPEKPQALTGEGRVTQISQLKAMEKIRLALLGNAFERSVLIRDSNKSVAMSAIKSPRVRENEAVAYSANRSLSHDIIRYIARRREWAKLYAVKLNLVLNPKTPMALSMGFLAHLYAHDVRKVSRSKNIPSALAKAAKRKQSRGR